jgi:hypothetical protein
MFHPTRHWFASAASDFVVRSASRPDVWAETGRAIELAYGRPAPIGQVVRLAIAIALLAAFKLGAPGVLG